MKPLKIISESFGYNSLISSLNEEDFEKIENVLDIGCGEGTCIFKILEKTYWGIDIDKKKIETLDSKLKEIEGNHKLEVADFNIHNFNETKFDLIIMKDFLNIIKTDQLRKTFDNAINLLKEGGVIYIRVNSEYYEDMESIRKNTNSTADAIKFIDRDGPRNYFKFEEIEDLFVDANIPVLFSQREDSRYTKDGYSLIFSSTYSFLGQKEKKS